MYGLNLIVLQKVREQEIRFWDERTFWHEIILEVNPYFWLISECT